MSHHGLTTNPNENPVSAGKVREACCSTLRELGDRLKQKVDQYLVNSEFAQDRRFHYVTDEGQIKLSFDLGDLANSDRSDEERGRGEGYYRIPNVVKQYLESYYGALGWKVDFPSFPSDTMYLIVGPISKELV